MMSLITPDSFLRLPANTNGNKAPISIFFITGNPGLIGYYHTFLSLLSDRLASDSETSFQIYGHSLAGFELGSDAEKNQKGKEKEAHYYNLEEQISYVQEKLDGFVENNYKRNTQDNGGEVPKVILIGHSVGTYIAMEVLRRHRERQRQHTTTTTTIINTPDNGKGAKFDVIGGVMLFPTVVDIAKSPAGQRLSKLLNLIPGLAIIASLFARVLSSLLPGGILRLVVAEFMGLSSSLESPDRIVVDTTCGFLGSKTGVRQALHLGADEMHTITSDKWSDDIWGMSDVEEPLVTLLFYFGRNDHWVAERTRDEIIAGRGKAGGNENGPTMVVCEDGLPHAFCLRYNEIMARKTGDMIRAVMEGQVR